MIKNSILQEIENWKRDNNIKAKNKYIPLLECYRRIHQFNKGSMNENLVLIAYPSEVKAVRDCFNLSNGKETPRVLNWYNLTDKGKKIISDLMSRISWNEKEINQFIFDLVY